MAINYASKYAEIVDLAYKKYSLTAGLETSAALWRESGIDPKTIYISSIALPPIKDTTRGEHRTDNRTPSINWNAHTFDMDREIIMDIDQMDLTETNVALLEALITEKAIAEFEEVDVYRFGAMAAKAIALSQYANDSDALTADNLVAAIDTGRAALSEAKVPERDRFLFLSVECNSVMSSNYERFPVVLTNSNNGEYDTRVARYQGMNIIEVPASMFNTSFDFTTNYVADGDPINFLIVHKDAVVPIIKSMVSKVIPPTINQRCNGYSVYSNFYHDIFFPAKKNGGMYVHYKG